MEPTLAMRWFYRNFEHRDIEPGPLDCAVCGLPMRVGVLRKRVLRNTFTDYDRLRVRDGQQVCEACAWYFGRQDLRRTGWWLTQNLAKPLKKRDWLPFLRVAVENGVIEDGYCLIKPLGLVGKHLALYAALTMAGSKSIVAQFDTMRVVVDRAFLDLVVAAHKLRERHSWKEIRTGNYYAKHILAWSNLPQFVELREVVQPWLGTAELALTEFLWSKEEK